VNALQRELSDIAGIGGRLLRAVTMRLLMEITKRQDGARSKRSSPS